MQGYTCKFPSFCRFHLLLFIDDNPLINLPNDSQGPTVGDVNGDGHTEIVVPTISGNIYVLSGKDGSLVQPFPYRTYGRIMSPVLLLDLSKREEKSKGLTLVTTSFDGYLYLIDGSTACTDVVDIGETSYVVTSLSTFI